MFDKVCVMDSLLKPTMEYEKLKLEKSNVWICKKTVSLLWPHGCRTFTHWTGCRSCTLELLQWGPRTECATEKHPKGLLSVHGWGPVPEHMESSVQCLCLYLLKLQDAISSFCWREVVFYPVLTAALAASRSCQIHTFSTFTQLLQVFQYDLQCILQPQAHSLVPVQYKFGK